MHDMFKYVLIGCQLIASVVLLVIVIVAAKFNQWGQNIINVGACLVLMVRLENIIAFYRMYLNSTYLQNQATFLMIFMVSLGKLGEKYNPTSPDANQALNKFCLVFLLVLIGVNLLYYAVMVITIVCYMCRQIYRLMKGTLLSSRATLYDEEIDLIKSLIKPYGDLRNTFPMVSHDCSICLSNFEVEDPCVILPGCEHCFHFTCIEEWLKTNSSCPYCRRNIRLGIMRSG